MALLLVDEKVAPRLDAFCSANRHLVSPSLSDHAVIAAIMSFPPVAFILVVAIS